MKSITLLAATAWLLAGCGASLFPKPAPPPARYALERPAATVAPAAVPVRVGAPTLMLSSPSTAPGYDSRRMAYQRETQRIDFFADSEWMEPPARLLTPLLQHALERSGAYRAVLLAPVNAAVDLRLDSELVQLVHDFRLQPSQVRWVLRITLVDVATRRLLGTRELTVAVAAPSEDAAGGVRAAQRAAEQLAADVALAVAGMTPR